MDYSFACIGFDFVSGKYFRNAEVPKFTAIQSMPQHAD
jgi:hypothetical protein